MYLLFLPGRVGNLNRQSSQLATHSANVAGRKKGTVQLVFVVYIYLVFLKSIINIQMMVR